MMASYSHAIVTVVGANVDMSVPPAPNGVCMSGTFAMSNVATMSLVDVTTFVELGLGSLENFYDGFAYVDTRTLAQDTRQSKIDMNAFTNLSNELINIVNVPDASTLNRASHYNTFTSSWVVVGRENVGVSCGGSTCVHVRTYSGGTETSDIVTSAQSGSGPEFGASFDEDFTYISYADGGGSTLGKFDSNTYTVFDTSSIGANGLSGNVNDSTYVYGVVSATAVIKRWLKTNLSAGATDFTPGLSAGTPQIPSYDTNGYIYVPARSAGASVNVIYRVRTSDMTIQGQITLGNTQFVGKVLIDEVNNKLYVVISSGTTQIQLVRANRTTLAVEETYSGISNANGPNMPFVQLDVYHQKIYVAQNGNGGVARIEKVNLCS